VKRADLVVGPNGAGKSTFVAMTLAPLLPRSVFVNADEIAKQRGPEEKIRERRRRLWALIATAIDLAGTTTIYDNSQRRGPRIVAQLSGGVIISSPSWPQWTPAPLRERWPD
jgi:predicted ABC-type ATPase